MSDPRMPRILPTDGVLTQGYPAKQRRGDNATLELQLGDIAAKRAAKQEVKSDSEKAKQKEAKTAANELARQTLAAVLNVVKPAVISAETGIAESDLSDMVKGTRLVQAAIFYCSAVREDDRAATIIEAEHRRHSRQKPKLTRAMILEQSHAIDCQFGTWAGMKRPAIAKHYGVAESDVDAGLTMTGEETPVQRFVEEAW